jgi:hypothetical protein
MSRGYESPLERAKRLTRENIDRGFLPAWVLDRRNGPEERDRMNRAKDADHRRSQFMIVPGGRRRIAE